MTKADFCRNAAEELAITHPGLPSAAVQVFLGHVYDRLTAEFGGEPEEGDLWIGEELVCRRCARLGSEGLSSEGYSGVSQSFTETLPPELRAAIGRRRKVRWS